MDIESLAQSSSTIIPHEEIMLKLNDNTPLPDFVTAYDRQRLESSVILNPSSILETHDETTYFHNKTVPQVFWKSLKPEVQY